MSGAGLFAHAVLRALKGAGRLITLRRVSPADFEPSPGVFTAISCLDILLMFVFAVAAFGLKGDLNIQEIPRTLMFIPLVLAVGLVASRLVRGSELLRLPVAFAAASVWMTVITSALYALSQHGWLPFTETYWSYIDDVVLVWSGAIVIAGAFRLLDGGRARRGAVALTAIALLVLPPLWLPQSVLWMPRYDESDARATGGFYTLGEERSFYAQQGALERELDAVQPERPGVPDIYVVAAGLYAGEDVFMKEVKMITALMGERFDARGRTVTLINNPKTLDEHPIASLTSLRESLKHVGETMNRDEDLLVLYISSHGSEKHELSVDFRPMRFATIDPARLKEALDESRIRWKVIVISACYSGGFVEALKDERTLVITASAADRTSFGCGSASDATYLAKALFGEALKKTYSFEAAFEDARKLIEKWEAEQGHTPSRPQIYVGAQIHAKLPQVEKRLAALGSRAKR